MTVESSALKKIGDKLGLDESKGYAVAVTAVLVFAAVLAGGYFTYLWATSGTPEKYSTIYVLSSDRTLDLPETVVIGQNNTFNVWVGVINQMRETMSFEIRLKITGEINPLFPIDAEPKGTYLMSLKDGEKTEKLASVSIDKPGKYMVFFELWGYYGENEAQFMGDNACVLKIEAINAS